MDKELFQKYLNNNCTPVELEETFRWLKEEAGSLQAQKVWQQCWQEYNPRHIHFEEERMERMLDKFHHRLNMYNFEHGLSKSTRKVKTPLQKITSFLGRAAAILFIPVTLALVYTSIPRHTEETKPVSVRTGNIQVIAPVGSRTFIELSDGTGVHLNHGSRLSYPREFTGVERRVALSGEAYFDVASNPEKPFLVDAGDLLITALGTEFNVRAYPDEKAIEATLAEGKIRLQKKPAGNRTETLPELEPGEHLRYLPEKDRYSFTKKDIRKYILWKDGILIFKDDPLQEVTQRLSRWHNVEFVFKDALLKDYPFTVTFVDETLPQALELLCLAIPMSYKITPRAKQPDGTFTKQQVILSLRK